MAMNKVKRPPLLTAAQFARHLGLSPARVSQLLHAENCPHLRVAGKVRFDPEVAIPWYMNRMKGSADVDAEPVPDDLDAETMARMATVVNRAIDEHVDALVEPEGRPANRLTELLGAIGLDDKAKYMARRAIGVWLGTTLPGGIRVHMEDPPANTRAGTWEAAFRSAVKACMTGAS